MKWRTAKRALLRILLISIALLAEECVPVQLKGQYLLPMPTGGTPLPIWSDENQQRCQSDMVCCGQPPGYLGNSQNGFEIEGADFCFLSPWANQTVDHQNVARICDDEHEGWRPMTFTIWAKGADVSHATATLVTGASSMTQSPAKSSDEDLGGGWGPGHILVFSFDYPCRFNQNLQLTVNGLIRNGLPLQIPPVTYEPHTTRSWMMVEPYAP